MAQGKRIMGMPKFDKSCLERIGGDSNDVVDAVRARFRARADLSSGFYSGGSEEGRLFI